MSYATPALFISKFGLTETTQLLADEENLLTTQLLRDAIAGAWTGTPTVDEQAAATAALARITRQLAVTSNTMDGYLRSALTLPLAAGDANMGALEDCCLALVRCGLADDSDNATERMDECCKTWRAWLKDVATGKTQLVVGGDPMAGTVSGKVHTGQARSGFCWGAFGGVR